MPNIFLRPAILTGCALILAACAPPPPQTGARGAGFDEPSEVIARREAALQSGAPTPSQVTQPGAGAFGGPAPLPQAATAGTTTEAQDIAARTRAALGQPADIPGAPAPLPAPAGTSGADLDRDNPAISREQDFGAVAQARDIQADADRLAAARQQYELVTPRELERPSDNGPNIIAYAVNQAKPRGASGTFSRNPLASERRAESRCAGYRTADVAQEEFLAAGGPARDRLGLDPDGDGNACNWDPATYVNLVRR